MVAQGTQLDMPIPIREAAKAVRRSVLFVKTHFIDTGKVTAYRTGGNDKKPWLRVKVSDLQRAIEEFSVYTPPAARRTSGAAKKRKPVKVSDYPVSVQAAFRD